MKKLFFLLLQLSLIYSAAAKPVNEKTAKAVAEHFMSVQTGKSVQLSAAALPDSLSDAMFLFEAQPTGFVIVSADDCSVPILGYSTTNRFSSNQMPPHVAAWFHDMKVSVEYTRDINPMPNAAKEWHRWLSGNPEKDAVTYTPIQPMLTTQWNQKPYYNSLCPVNPSDSIQAPAGCVAVAMGQIMKYWGYPQSGRGSFSYDMPNYGTISAHLDSSVYDWSNMPDSLNELSTDTQVYAVAKLLFDAGVAVHMQYGNIASGSQTQSFNQIDVPCAENALKNVFGYSQSLHAINYEYDFFTEDEWTAYLRSELDCGRPILYSGVSLFDGGHAFILDGYDSLSLFHMNFGWGGLYDGYYLGHIACPGNDYFITYRTAIVGIAPAASIQDSVMIDAFSYDTTMGTVAGSGRYASYIDTVSLLATANEGFKFIGWTDGSMYNPRTFIPNENGSFTALFSKIDSTYMSYCHNYSYASALSQTHWGVKFPASSLTGLQSLKAIRIHITQSGDYTFVIYQGGEDQPEQEVYRITKHLSTSSLNLPDEYEFCQIDPVYHIDRSRPLWITVMADSLPAAVGYYSGNRDGMLVNGDSGWYSYNDIENYFSWSISAEFNPRNKYRVTATLDTPDAGHIVGVDSNNFRYYLNGDTATLIVICTGTDPETGLPYRFVCWNDGSTDNPYSFVVDRQKTLIAHVEPSSGESVEEVSLLTPRVSSLGLLVDIDCKNIPSDINIYNTLGRVIYTDRSASTSITMPGKDIYLIKITNKYGCKTFKVVCW